MTRRRLNRIIGAVAIYLMSYIAGASWAKYLNLDMYAVLKDFVAIAVALPAALLAGAFQRRISYLQALREYWKQLIPAVQSVLQYTYRTAATQEQFASVYVQLSSMIDITRSVFANVPTAGTRSGLYPFENLKDILEVLSGLDSTKRSEATQNDCSHDDASPICGRKCILPCYASLIEPYQLSRCQSICTPAVR